MYPQDTMPYSTMLALADSNQQQQQPMPQPGMSSVIDPAASQSVTQMQKPAATPQELENRKSAWTTLAEKLQDPNVLRALGFAGATMMMPGATLGHGALVGMSAFQAGQSAADEKVKSDRVLAMKEQETGAQVRRLDAGTEGTQAETGLTQARTPGVAAQARVLEATAEDRIAQAKTDREAAELALSSAKSDEDVKKIERQLKQRRGRLEQEVPDAKLRATIAAEMDAVELRLKETREKIKKSESDRQLTEITVDQLKKMPDEEKKQFLTKTGKYSTATGSAIMQQAGMWGSIYDKLPADDPQKKGKTREQFQMTQLQSTKAKDVTDMMKNYVLAGGDDAEVLSMFGDILKGQLSARSPGATATPAGGKETAWQDMGRGMEYRVLADGTRQVRRKGGATSATSNMGETKAP